METEYNRDAGNNRYTQIIVSHFFYPTVGGLEHFSYMLAKSFAQKGEKVLVIHGGSSCDMEYSMNGFECIGFKTTNLFNNTYPLFGLRFITTLAKSIIQNRDAKVVFSSRHLVSSILGALVCIALGKKYILIEHNSAPAMFRIKPFGKLVNLIDRFVFGFVPRAAKKVVAVSDTCAEFIHSYLNIDYSKIQTIHNFYELHTEKSTFSDYSDKQNIVVFAAKHIPVKDPVTAYKAMNLAAKSNPDWRFVFIGSGSLKMPNLKTEKNFESIEGFMNIKELHELYKDAKININSSISEGLALNVIESAALGCLPVLSDAPSNIEVAKKIGVERYLFERGDVNGLASALSSAINDIEKKPNILRQISEDTETYFSSKNQLNKYFKLLANSHNRSRLFRKHAMGSKLGYGVDEKLISIIMPVFNEERYVGAMLNELKRVKFPGYRKEIIIINDASYDDTKEIIQDFSNLNEDENLIVKYLENEKNLGKSMSVKKGIMASSGDFVVIQDADLEYNPKDLVKFVEVFNSEPYIDVIYGDRLNEKVRGENVFYSYGNRFLTYVSNLFTQSLGFKVNDMETCYKMVRGNVIRAIASDLVCESGFTFEPEITAKLAAYSPKLEVKNLLISYNPRNASEGKKISALKDGIPALSAIIKYNTTIQKPLYQPSSYNFINYARGDNIRYAH